MPDGSLSNESGFPTLWASSIAHARKNHVPVDLGVACIGWDTVHAVLNKGISNAVNNIIAGATGTGMDGVSMDIEFPSAPDMDKMTAFMCQLADTCHARGLTLSMTISANNWCGGWDFETLSDSVDLLFPGSYDNHWTKTPPGPNAPLTGWEGSIRTLMEPYIAAHCSRNLKKICMGVPYYGYEWQTDTGEPHARAIGDGRMRSYVEMKSRAQQDGELWDPESQTPWYHFRDSSGNWHQGWYDDDSSLALKYGDVDSLGWGGIQIWHLNEDLLRGELWGALREAFMRLNPPS